MSLTFYLPRTLNAENKTYSEASLLAASRFIVVLAEPGAGKTRLMESLAQQLGTSAVTANRFAHTRVWQEGSPLLIDAYDELAKVDASGIYKLLGYAHEVNPSVLVLSSRSSEWDTAATSAFKDFFGGQPLIARLQEFSKEEQRKIFEHHTPHEDFFAFQAEVGRFDLETLLPNPQFLTLFADAYVQSGRSFTDKRAIFSQATERLAKEVNVTLRAVGGTLSISQKIDYASEVFAKLLLSGAEGVATNEANEDSLYPLLETLVEDATAIHAILSSRLFKPGDTVDTHRPIHKIVAEYAAADYLTKRVADPADTLTFERCLPVIAPNSTVRDELRGLLGWVAALGNKSIQEAAIKLDPYAVLANGDPSQLEPSSKRLLVDHLKAVEEKDPYFRRSDFWRRFSAAGFFTSEVVSEIKPLLSTGTEGHLKGLVLELLSGSPAIKHLADELRALVLSPEEDEHTRLLALSCLMDQGEAYNHHPDLAVLIFEASQASLRVAAKAIEKLGPQVFSNQYLSDFLRVCTHLYPGHKERFERTIGERHFVKRLIGQLDLATTEFLLNELSRGLTCTCGKNSFECDCRNGTSKIVGALLDRYFVLASGPYEPAQVWSWVKNLNFHENKSAEQSKAVEILQKNRELRQGIIKHVFGVLWDSDEISKTKIHRFELQSHSGLVFHQEDYSFIVDHAFDTDNTTLWVAFRARHQFYRSKEERAPDELRRHMREQALRKPAFMREWAKCKREDARFERELRIPNLRHPRRMKRRRRQENEIRVANINYIYENRDLVESGRHWNCLVKFAWVVLMKPDKIEEKFGDENIVRNALRNCLSFIELHIPALTKLAELQCASQNEQSEMILYAACLELIRRDGDLNEVPINLLWALRTNLDMYYDAVQEDEREALKAEVNRLAFSTDEAAEQFCLNYIEPQLRNPKCNHSQVDWLLHDPAFQPLAPKLAYQWLCNFPLMPLSALETLFEIVAQWGDRERLKDMIANRSAEALSSWWPELSSEGLEERRIFWFIRAFYFLEGTSNPYWDWLKSDKDNVLLFNERSGRMNRSDHPSWPTLTADKVEAILDAFFIHWPIVHLPNSWGTESPKDETAYRFLTEVIWNINSDDPDDAIPSLKRLLGDARYSDLHKDMQSMLAGLERKKALRDFEPPSPSETIAMLDCGAVVTVEGLRQLVLRELSKLQGAIDGGEFNTAERFYAGNERLDEESCTRIIAERLSLIFEPQNIAVTPEHHLKHDKRCDFTTAKVLAGKRRMLVTEVKGQWHPKLYEAASNQLSDMYAIHPDAEQQGIYLVLWFGRDEKVAGKKKHQISDANGLKAEIEGVFPSELTGLIDVFVLDVSNEY
jgi:hypothetical protein